MSTLREILQNVDELVPNDISVASKIRWINQAQWDIFRELSQQTIDTVETMAGISYYNLPEGCIFELIDSVTMVETAEDGTKIPVKLPYKHMYEQASGRFYYRYGSMVGIYPTPQEDGIEITFVFKKRPNKLTEGDLDNEPELMADFHDMLEIACIIKIYKAREDVEMANNYQMEYNGRLLELKEDMILQEPEYAKTQDVLPRRASRTSFGSDYFEEDEE